MSKGIIYCMTTIVPGLIKIGKTGSDTFENRMYHLEHNGYSNITGLQRCFAIEVENYDEKERLIDDIFCKSRVGNTELFALDVNLVIPFLSALDGKQVYPEDKTKELVFEETVEVRETGYLPDGEYYFDYTPRVGKPCKAVLRKENGQLYLCKGSTINTESAKDDLPPGWKAVRNSSDIADGVVVNDIKCDSLSMAAVIVRGQRTNGWKAWKTRNGMAVDIYREMK